MPLEITVSVNVLRGQMTDVYLLLLSAYTQEIGGADAAHWPQIGQHKTSAKDQGLIAMYKFLQFAVALFVKNSQVQMSPQ